MTGYTEREVEICILRLASQSFGIYESDEKAQGAGVDCTPYETVEGYLPGGKGARVLEALEYVKQRCDGLEQQLVDALRAGGCSWAEIGDSLRISRQAAQQKFARPVSGTDVREGLRILTPTSRNEELTELRRAAAEGWVPYRSFYGYHVLRRLRTGTWELRRKFVFNTAPKESDGWRVATIRFPDAFLVRQVEKDGI